MVENQRDGFEQLLSTLHPRVGRVALKYIGDAYLFSKSADRDTNDV